MANDPFEAGPYSTYVFDNTNFTAPVTTTQSVTNTGVYTQYAQGFNQRQFTEQWLEYQRLMQQIQNSRLDALRQTMLYGSGTWCGTGVQAREPEKLETKALSAADRERLLEAIPF